jgi:hypothetical protein
VEHGPPAAGGEHKPEISPRLAELIEEVRARVAPTAAAAARSR